MLCFLLRVLGGLRKVPDKNHFSSINSNKSPFCTVQKIPSIYSNLYSCLQDTYSVTYISTSLPHLLPSSQKIINNPSILNEAFEKLESILVSVDTKLTISFLNNDN